MDQAAANVGCLIHISAPAKKPAAKNSAARLAREW
jgi:hypothetical protein